jgi:hypothetical protein
LQREWNPCAFRTWFGVSRRVALSPNDRAIVGCRNIGYPDALTSSRTRSASAEPSSTKRDVELLAQTDRAGSRPTTAPELKDRETRAFYFENSSALMTSLRSVVIIFDRDPGERRLRRAGSFTQRGRDQQFRHDDGLLCVRSRRLDDHRLSRYQRARTVASMHLPCAGRLSASAGIKTADVGPTASRFANYARSIRELRTADRNFASAGHSELPVLRHRIIQAEGAPDRKRTNPVYANTSKKRDLTTPEQERHRCQLR